MSMLSNKSPSAGVFAKIDRVWKMGDVVTLRFSMKPRKITGFNESISIERCTIAFSYPIGESWLKSHDRNDGGLAALSIKGN